MFSFELYCIPKLPNWLGSTYMHSFQHREISKYKYSTVQQYKKEQYYQEKYEKIFKENIFKMRICMIIMSKKQSDPHKFTESEFFT